MKIKNATAYFEAIEFYEENLTEDNADEVIQMLQDMFPAEILMILIDQGFFIAPSKRN
jgi:hypothetical protein